MISITKVWGFVLCSPQKQRPASTVYDFFTPRKLRNLKSLKLPSDVNTIISVSEGDMWRVTGQDWKVQRARYKMKSPEYQFKSARSTVQCLVTIIKSRVSTQEWQVKSASQEWQVKSDKSRVTSQERQVKSDKLWATCYEWQVNSDLRNRDFYKIPTHQWWVKVDPSSRHSIISLLKSNTHLSSITTAIFGFNKSRILE